MRGVGRVREGRKERSKGRWRKEERGTGSGRERLGGKEQSGGEIGYIDGL